MRFITFIIMLIFIVGCSSTSTLENLQGSSDARYKIQKNYKSKFIADNTKCIELNSTYEIWLDDLKINQLFDGRKEKFIDKNNLNELAIFLNIKERTPGEINSTTVAEGLMLSYKDGIGVNNPPNEDDALIYAGVYHGGDIILEIKVIEYDDKTKKLFQNATKAFRETLLSNNLINKLTKIDTEKMLGYFTNNLVKKVTKNDLILNHKTVLHACNSFKHSNKEKFFIDGVLTIIRTPNSMNSQTKWGNDSNLSNDVSYITLRIVQRD